MRSLILSLSLLLLAVAVMLGAAFHLRHSCDRLCQAISTAPSTLPDAQVLQNQQLLWEKHAPLFSLAAPRSSIRRIRELLLTLQSCLDKQPSVLAEMTLAQLKDAVKQLKKDTLSLSMG